MNNGDTIARDENRRFTEAIRSEEAWMLAEARRQLGRYLDAKVGPDDIVQEAKRRVWRSLHRTDPNNVLRFRGFLRRQIRFAVLDAVAEHAGNGDDSSARLERPLARGEEIADPRTTLRTRMSREQSEIEKRRQAAEKARLRGRQREATALLVAGAKVAEIMQSQNRSKGAVYALLRRAAKKIKSRGRKGDD